MAQNQTGVVLITGASGGIGKAVAEKFAQNGYRVALHYHNGKERAEALQQELEAQGCTVMAVQADLRESSQAEAMIKQIEQQWGGVDVLVNNAGVAQQKLFTDITDEEWRNMFAIHVDGAFYCSRAVLPGMIRTDRWEKNPDFYEDVPSRFTPLGDVADGADVADAVWYFAAHARNTTGAELVVDGGNTIQLYPTIPEVL